MSVWKSLAGIYSAEVTSADCAYLLSAINNCNIAIFDIEYLNDLCVRISFCRFDLYLLQKCVENYGGSMKIVGKIGVYWSIRNLVRRPIFTIGMLLFAILVVYLPTRVLFVHVEGNKTIPTQLIIDSAKNCGIGFGASRRTVRSEKIKNALLSAVPQLQWAGVNTAGCVAIISVEERSVVNDSPKQQGISSIVAACDGIIQEITVLKGNALCKAGQAVKRGQVLVSGYTNCGILIKATDAQAEVVAQTLRTLELVTPVSYNQRESIVAEKVKYSIRIGKNIIKLCKDSGISDTSCVKMYEEDYIVLPGGFQLPVSLITERNVYYNTASKVIRETNLLSWLEITAKNHLSDQMLAGRILFSNVDYLLQDEICQLKGNYVCAESIGRVRSEEFINGKRD